MFREPVCQLAKAFGKRGKARLMICCPSVLVGHANTGINPSFMSVQATAVFAEDFEHSVPPMMY